MSALQFSPCNEAQLEVDLQFIDHPLGFVLDAGNLLIAVFKILDLNFQKKRCEN